MESRQIIIRPSSTEKSIRAMESDNKLVFIVDKKASKVEIKQALELLFKASVVDVKTHITNGKKKAFVKFGPETPAIDIATQLGLI